jgi:hypothetical protein
LIFPKKLVFENNTFQTTKPSEILNLLFNAGKAFSYNQKEKSSKNAAQSCIVTPTGQFSNHLLERFKKIYELKAVIPVQMLQLAILPRKLRVG